MVMTMMMTVKISVMAHDCVTPDDDRPLPGRRGQFTQHARVHAVSAWFTGCRQVLDLA